VRAEDTAKVVDFFTNGDLPNGVPGNAVVAVYLCDRHRVIKPVGARVTRAPVALLGDHADYLGEQVVPLLPPAGLSDRPMQ
jgi:hypothetical protein